jgi:hypothetical protein
MMEFGQAGLRESNLPESLENLPDLETGLIILQAFAMTYESWEHGTNCFPIHVIVEVWQDHANRDFPWELGNTLFHGRYLREAYCSGKQSWLTGRDAMRRRWLECFNDMLSAIREPEVIRGSRRRGGGWLTGHE